MIVKKRSFNQCIIKRSTYDQAVITGQATTPSQMYDLAQQGKPISAQLLSDDYFDDGVPGQDFNVPLERQRGIDVNDMWEAQRDAKVKLRKFGDKQHKQKGEVT